MEANASRSLVENSDEQSQQTLTFESESHVGAVEKKMNENYLHYAGVLVEKEEDDDACYKFYRSSDIQR